MGNGYPNLANTCFDCTIIGGGIYGAWTALHASRLGLKTLLVEQADWGSGTSQASSKLIHGGLRYLRYGHFGLVRKALAERAHLMQHGSHRIHPLTFLIPVYQGHGWSRPLLKAGLLCYDFLSGFQRSLPRHQWLEPAACQSHYSFLNRQKLKGGFQYGDLLTDDARYTLELVSGARTAGAQVFNYTRALRFQKHPQTLSILLENSLTGEQCEVRTRLAVYQGGPWPFPDTGTATLRLPRLQYVKGVHLVMPALPCQDALLLTSRRNQRVIFLIPWYGRTLLGTTESPWQGDPAQASVSREEATYLLETCNQALREPAWTARDICGAFAGVRTLEHQSATALSALSRDWKIVRPASNIWMSVGGKLTTARMDTARLVQQMCVYLKRTRPDLKELERPLPWFPSQDYAAWHQERVRQGRKLGLADSIAASLPARYGRHCDLILERIQCQPDLGTALVPDLPFCRAEVLHSLEHEMCQTLEDLLRRRIPLGILCRHLPDSFKVWLQKQKLPDRLQESERFQQEWTAFEKTRTPFTD